MNRLLSVFLVSVAILTAQGSPQVDRASLPVGMWRIEFANKVVEMCEVGCDGGCWVDEPLRRSVGVVDCRGKACLARGPLADAFILRFKDDRMERWTPVGSRFVVEHFYPGSRVPSATPVLGIAERSE